MERALIGRTIRVSAAARRTRIIVHSAGIYPEGSHEYAALHLAGYRAEELPFEDRGDVELSSPELIDFSMRHSQSEQTRSLQVMFWWIARAMQSAGIERLTWTEALEEHVRTMVDNPEEWPLRDVDQGELLSAILDDPGESTIWELAEIRTAERLGLAHYARAIRTGRVSFERCEDNLLSHARSKGPRWPVSGSFTGIDATSVPVRRWNGPEGASGDTICWTTTGVVIESSWATTDPVSERGMDVWYLKITRPHAGQTPALQEGRAALLCGYWQTKPGDPKVAHLPEPTTDVAYELTWDGGEDRGTAPIDHGFARILSESDEREIELWSWSLQAWRPALLRRWHGETRQ